MIHIQINFPTLYLSLNPLFKITVKQEAIINKNNVNKILFNKLNEIFSRFLKGLSIKKKLIIEIN